VTVDWFTESDRLGACGGRFGAVSLGLDEYFDVPEHITIIEVVITTHRPAHDQAYRVKFHHPPYCGTPRLDFLDISTGTERVMLSSFAEEFLAPLLDKTFYVHVEY
jgi:hypothetical protein